MKLTRRQLAATALVGQAVRMSAQPQAPANPDVELQAARDRLKATAADLAPVAVPMDTEPAFQFKA